MADKLTVTYGELNWETIGRWLHLDPADDGPVWMLNLMKYRPRADYGKDATTEMTGKEADDAYAPLGPLAAVGATVVLFGDVTDQTAGVPSFDRVAVVRYPTRASFFEMQQRDDFKRQHVHKEAGMAFTIVAGCLPESVATGPPGDGRLVLRLRRLAEGARPDPDPEGVVAVIRFAVDGVVLGDERHWNDACFDRVDPAALGALAATGGVEEQVVVVVAPTVNHLVASVDPAQAYARRP